MRFQGGRLCKKDLENLKKWSSSATADLENALTSQGEYDLIFLARQFKKAFPQLLKSSTKDAFIVRKHR